MLLLKHGPFLRSLLNAVFTEQHLALKNERCDIFYRPRFRYGDELNVLRRTARQLCSGSHACTDGRQTVGGFFWCRFLHNASL